jgi:multidrug efflux system outer membrane protein
VLGDTTLQGLVRIALRENRDLHIALGRVNEARALLGIQRFEMYPQINIQGRVGHSNGADSLISGVSGNELGFLGVSLNGSWTSGAAAATQRVGQGRTAGQ